jgi:hypothetical protein
MFDAIAKGGAFAIGAIIAMFLVLTNLDALVGR